jgi:hypothetical protein
VVDFNTPMSSIDISCRQKKSTKIPQNKIIP